MNSNDKAHARGTHLRDQAHADQVRRVRDNGKKIGLSRRETDRRVNRVSKRFGAGR